MKQLIILIVLVIVTSAYAREYHVAVGGNDTNDGSEAKPLKTISAAAEKAQPGDTVTVHTGVYRERVNPPRGGTSDTCRIVYQAAPGEKVVITGAEVVKGWEKVGNDTWKVAIPNAFFGGFNPFTDKIQGEWCYPTGRHAGAVYLNGDWFAESLKLDPVLKPAGKQAMWFAQVDAQSTTLWAQFPGVNPNAAIVEVSKRQSVFYPSKTGINYITVRGFTLRQAATPWAGAMSEQIGLIGTHWSKGWIIENNDISYSMCTGVTLGRYQLPKGEKLPVSDEGFVKSIKLALRDGWSKEKIGSHIVRNNHISHCEKNGIHGSLGAMFSEISGNEIHDIAIRGWVRGADTAGIKLLGSADMVIRDNHIYRCGQLAGIWLDWMAQGTQVVGNLLHDNADARCDLVCEVNHGPYLVANNLFLSHQTLFANSLGGAYAHNLMMGSLQIGPNKRRTAFLKAHSTELVDLHDLLVGDARWYNNLLASRCNLNAYNSATMPVVAAGNVFTKGAIPSRFDVEPLLKPSFDPAIKLIQKDDGWYLELAMETQWVTEQKHKLVTTELLGKAKIPNLPFENPDGSALKIDTDYFGIKRDVNNPFPGPFEITQGGKQLIKVWPKP